MKDKSIYTIYYIGNDSNKNSFYQEKQKIVIYINSTIITQFKFTFTRKTNKYKGSNSDEKIFNSKNLKTLFPTRNKK